MSDLNEKQRIDRAARAQRAWDEFIGPEFDYARSIYSARIAEVAATELHPGLRSDKITTLSMSVRVLNEIQGAIAAVIRDGEVARAEMIRAERIEDLSDARQRLLRVAPY